jgi:hypothetical protein
MKGILIFLSGSLSTVVFEDVTYYLIFPSACMPSLRIRSRFVPLSHPTMLGPQISLGPEVWRVSHMVVEGQS